MAREKFTDADLLDAVRHVVYEYANLVSAGRLLETPLAPPINTHVQDAFLLSVRKMADFFIREPKQHDVAAFDFTTSRVVYSLPTWSQWEVAVDKQLAHVTWKRDQSWDGSANKPLLQELETAWKLFLSKLDPKFQARFRDEINKKKQCRGFEKLDLG